MLALTLTCFMACGAKTENKLVIYSPVSEEQIREITSAFEKDTGIKVEMISVVTGEVFKRLKSEKNNPYADVAWAGDKAIYRDNLDLFEDYVSVNNEELPEEYRNIAGKLTIYGLDASVLLVNKNRIGGIAVEGYEDLLNPELKDKMIMGDPSGQSTAYAQLINMLIAEGGDLKSQQGWDYVQSLLANINGKIGNSSGAVHKSVADGEYAVALTFEDPSITYVRNGAPVDVVYMKEGVVFNPVAAAVVKGAKHAENAKKFIDFLTSQKGQDIYGSKLNVRPVRTDAKLGDYMKPLSEIKILYPDDIYVKEHRSEILDKYKAIFAEINK